MESTFKKNLTFFKILILISTIILYPTICFSDANKIFKENSKAVVVIVTYDDEGNPMMQGSGFIVRLDGAIVTNYHVISNAEDIEVKAGESVLKIKGVLYIDKENDIVILKSDAEGLPVVKIGDVEKAEVGENVYVISSPQGLENTISDGILSGIREIEPKRKILQITAPISKGSSGSPVFNKDGEVIGIATFLIEEAQNINFAMPISLIKDKVSAKKVIALKEVEPEDYKKTGVYWFNLGCYYGETGLYKEAIDAFKQALRIKPDAPGGHLGLGIVYSDLGMYSEAIEEYKQVIRIKPDFAGVHLNLGIAYMQLGMYKEAIEAYKQAIWLKPDYLEVHGNLGVVYDSLGMYREAIEAYKQVIRIKPDDEGAHYNIGITYMKLGMHSEAKEAFKQAIRIEPDYAKAHLGLGFIYSISNDRGLALEEYKILKDLDPELANKLFNLIYK